MTAREPTHRIVTVRMLNVSMLAGLILAVASVPYGTLVRESMKRDWPSGGLPGLQRGVGIIPPSPGFEEYHRWNDFGPFIEMNFADPGARGSISLAWVPAAAQRHILQTRQPTDVFWSGYPFKCAVGWWEFHGDRAWLIKWGQVRHRTVVTPLRPMWVGLLGNTLVYAALLLVPWTGVRFIRTRRRRARGRCVACAYELGAGIEVCPECGLAAKTS